jgi:hypothetical protein
MGTVELLLFLILALIYTVELLLFLILALIYLAIPIITLVIVVRINNRLTKIEQEINLLHKST